jgi:uncharacterized protein YidB (DUF937 family)
MSLFDSVLGAVQSQTQTQGSTNISGANSNMITAILAMLNSPELGGDLTGLIGKFSQAGLKEQVASWVSTGKNLPVSGEQIQAALGSPLVQNIAEKLGINSDDAAAKLATTLPQVIDKLTPDGEISKEGNLMALGISALSGFLGNKAD